MIINKINTEKYFGFKCLASDKLVLWNDDDIVSSIEGSCVLAVVSSLCPETCAVGGLPFSEYWASHYDKHASMLSLEEMIQNLDIDAIAFQINQSGTSCGPYQDTTYFLIPNNPGKIQLYSDY